MSRKSIILITIGLFGAAVVWYASGFVNMPEVTFAQASQINEASTAEEQKKAVMVTGTVVRPEAIVSGQGQATFYLRDKEGREEKVQFTSADDLTGGQLDRAAKSKSIISVTGHSHPDYFHAGSVAFPAY